MTKARTIAEFANDLNINSGEVTLNNVADAYLSGGIYFGTAGVTSGTGTETSNYLSSYEEGTWTPALTNFTLGNGTSVGRYYKINSLVTVIVNIIWGTTTSASGIMSITNLPFTSLPILDGIIPRWQSVAQYGDYGSGSYVGYVYVDPDSTTMTLRYISTTNGLITNINASNPFTWTSTDFICIIASYETNS